MIFFFLPVDQGLCSSKICRLGGGRDTFERRAPFQNFNPKKNERRVIPFFFPSGKKKDVDSRNANSAK